MECPRCGSTNVTSTGMATGIWQCMEPGCGKKFDRDTNYNWVVSRSLNGQRSR